MTTWQANLNSSSPKLTHFSPPNSRRMNRPYYLRMNLPRSPRTNRPYYRLTNLPSSLRRTQSLKTRLRSLQIFLRKLARMMLILPSGLRIAILRLWTVDGSPKTKWIKRHGVTNIAQIWKLGMPVRKHARIVSAGMILTLGLQLIMA